MDQRDPGLETNVGAVPCWSKLIPWSKPQLSTKIGTVFPKLITEVVTELGADPQSPVVYSFTSNSENIAG
jgi:hypothetical protein